MAEELANRFGKLENALRTQFKTIYPMFIEPTNCAAGSNGIQMAAGADRYIDFCFKIPLNTFNYKQIKLIITYFYGTYTGTVTFSSGIAVGNSVVSGFYSSFNLTPLADIIMTGTVDDLIMSKEYTYALGSVPASGILAPGSYVYGLLRRNNIAGDTVTILGLHMEWSD